MFLWYQRSKVCFVFLTFERSHQRDEVSFLSSCRWFSRGWTLQELLAPPNVIFYDARLQQVGTKQSLAHSMALITGIEEKYLLQLASFREASVAQRMSWASKRQTSRVEDVAYCLLGIFDVNMPLLYGEGQKAFLRLQQQIIAQSNDESIFAWTSSIGRSRPSIFAESPDDFRRSGHIRRLDSFKKRPPYVVTNRGLQLHISVTPWRLHWWTLSMLPLREDLPIWLDCECVDGQSHKGVAIRVRPVPSSQFRGTDWFRPDTTKLMLRDQSRTARWVHLLFASHIPIYIVQLSHDRHPPVLHPPLGRSGAFNDESWRHHRMTMFVASFVLLFCAVRHSIVSIDPSFPLETAWTWYYLNLGFTICHCSYAFLLLVRLILHLESYFSIASMGISTAESIFAGLILATLTEAWISKLTGVSLELLLNQLRWRQ